MTINIRITQAITGSINILKTNLTKAELSEVKNAFDNIYRCKSDVSNSYRSIFQNKSLNMQKQVQVEQAFYNIGDHIAIPSRTGTTKLLDSAYSEDVSTNAPTFLEYQQEVIGYVHNQISNLDG